MPHQQYETISFEKIENLQSYFYLQKDKLKYINNLSNINLFVGPNNSGKSRFLREIFKSKFSYVPNDIDINILRENINSLKELTLNTFKLFHITGVGPINEKIFNQITNLTFFENANSNQIDEIKRILNVIITHKNFRDNAQFIPGKEMHRPLPQPAFSQKYQHIIDSAKEALKIIENYSLTIGNEQKIYIPILRGLRPIFLATNDSDLLLERSIKDYFSEENRKGIFTGQQLYSTMKKNLLGHKSSRTLHQRFEDFLSKHFFDEQPVEIIPYHDADTIQISIGNNGEFPIFNLGDGLQTIIIITYLAFTNSKRNIFFIEEPDTYLHAGMQRKLIEVLINNEQLNRHQYFFTTHSNHLLDLTYDYTKISIYAFQRDDKEFQIKLASSGDKNVLSELGVRNSSVFLTNASIWVEGVTDRLYLREYINKLDTENLIKEDTHYSFVEFSGSNIAHWNFEEVSEDYPEELESEISSLRLCGDPLVILDGDNINKGNRLEKLKKQLNENLLLLESKEIENLLPSNVIIFTANEILKNSKKYKSYRLDEEKIKIESYHKKDVALGKYLDEILNISYFSAKSGTFKADLKNKFCSIAVEFMRKNSVKWELTEEAKEIVTKISEFVKNANSHNQQNSKIF